MTETATPTVLAAFNAITESNLCMIDGPEIDLLTQLETLCDAIDATDDTDSWVYLGEGGMFTASDLIVGAYWALSEWHAGQSSHEYRVLSRLGDIFSPGMSHPPTEAEYGEWDAYSMVCRYCEKYR